VPVGQVGEFQASAGRRIREHREVELNDLALDDDVVVERRADVLWRAAPGFLVVATVDDEVHEAVGPAPEIWRAIGRPVSIGELVTSLADAHGLPPERIRGDVASFVVDLIGVGLVVTRG
jgi:hypothetical protein